MQKILNWKAQRSGATMTIIGQDEAGKHVKVAGVVDIHRAPVADESTGLPGPVVASTEPGLEYELV